MEKKVTAQGPKTRKSYTVTLPIDWVRAEQVDQSMKVNLEEIGTKILISSKDEKKRDIAINYGDYEKTIQKVLNIIYRSGVDTLRINFKAGDDLLPIIETIEKFLIGYEIVEQTTNHMIIKDITTEADQDLNNIIRRIFIIVLSFKDAESPERLGLLYRNFKRFLNFAERVLIKSGHREFRKTPIHFRMVEKMKQIGNDLMWMIKEKRGTEDKLLLEFIKLLEDTQHLYFKFTIKEYNRLQYVSFKLINKTLDHKKDNISSEHMYVYHMAKIVNNFVGEILMLHIFDHDGPNCMTHQARN